MRVEIPNGRGIQDGDYGTQTNIFIENYFAEHDPAANSNIFDHVPESNAEIEYVMGSRPPAWEYLMYAGLLQFGLRGARREGEARRSLRLVCPDSQAALKQTSALMGEMKFLTQEVMDCFEPVLLSRALREPGRPGEFRLIYDIANRLVIAYEKFVDWGELIRITQVPRRARRLYGMLSHLADRPMRDIEDYVSRLVAELNDAVHRASLGDRHPVVLKFACVVHADEGLIEEVVREVERIKSTAPGTV